MRLKQFILTLAVPVTLFAVSCSNKNEPVRMAESVIPTFQAKYCEVVVSTEETKHSVGAVSYDVTWQTSDLIAVVNVTKGYRVDKYRPAAAGSDVENLVAITAGDYSEGDVVYAVYPYDAVVIENGKLKDNVLKVNLESGLGYTSQSVNPAFSRNDIQVSDKMTITAPDTSPATIFFRLHRMVSLVSISSHISDSRLQGVPIADLTVSIEGCAGDAEITFDGDSPMGLANNSGTQDSMSIVPVGKTMSTISEAALFIPIYPASMSSGISFVFETDDYQVGFYRKVASSLSASRNMAFPLFEGAYTRVLTQADATSDKTWWVLAKDSAYQDTDAGSYRDSSLPGNGAGGYENGNGNAWVDPV